MQQTDELFDLVHVAKAVEHMRHGRKQEMLDEYSLVRNPLVLPDWDEVAIDMKLTIYDLANQQLIKEGYREAAEY